jgi:hypothetical protein
MILERIKEYIDFKKIAISAFERSVGMSNASFGKSLKNGGAIGTDKLENILIVYTDINPIWLLTGEGSMLRDNKNPEERKGGSTLISPVEESIIYKIYKEKDEENKTLIEEIGGLKERIRQLEFQNKESDHHSIVDDITEAFTKESSGDYGEDSIPTKLPSGSKRSSVGKV